MNLSPREAEEALAAIRQVTQKTRHSIASSGAYLFLIITGAIWMVGFLANQFLPGGTAAIIWGVMSVAGSALAILLGTRLGKRGHSPSTAVFTRRAVVFWGFLVLAAAAVILITHPSDGKQMTMLIVLFLMIGQQSMDLLFDYSSTLWALPIAALALAGYFLLPAYFYLWMGVLVGGGMIALGLYIRSRW
jgi:hypothetical protein